MRLIILYLFAPLLVAAPAMAAPAPAAAPPAMAAPPAKATDEGWQLIQQSKPAEAIVSLDRVIAAEARTHAGERRQIYCAHTPEESLLYLTTAASEKKDAIVLDPSWCMAIFLKGFALIDLNRPDDARPLLEQALAMAPMNAQFLSELGEWHKVRHEWDRAYTLFERAVEASLFSEEAYRKPHKGRALRGMGFVLIEQGKLDDAERLFRQCLEIDPNDDKAKNELDYIRQQRERRI